MQPALARALAKDSVITRKRYPGLTSRLARAAAEGRLTRLLPGVYTLPDRSRDLATRAEAACRYDPEGVVIGDAAAALSYWPELEPDTIVVAGRHHRLEQAGYTFVRRAIPPALDAGITGWSANVMVDTAYGDYVVDIVFHHSPLCIELDGREFHGAAKFDGDRLRGNELLLAGRQVLRFTWAMIDRRADLVLSTVQRALKQFGPDAAGR